MSSNLVCNHTRDKQIGLPLCGRLMLLSLVWLQAEFDSTQSYYHYLICDNKVLLYFKTYPTGKGLGKEESGISKAIKVNIKTDTAGVSIL